MADWLMPDYCILVWHYGWLYAYVYCVLVWHYGWLYAYVYCMLMFLYKALCL